MIRFQTNKTKAGLLTKSVTGNKDGEPNSRGDSVDMELFKIYSLDNLEFAQSHTLREDPDPLRPAGAAEIADAGEVETPGVITHKL